MKVTYMLRKERHLNQESIPKRTRQIRAQMEQAETNNDPLKYVDLSMELVEMFADVCDYGLVIKYAEAALKKLKHVRGKRGVFNELAALSNLCAAYRNLGGFDFALKAAERYLKRARETNSPPDVLEAKFEISLAYLGRGEVFDDDEDYQNGLKYSQQASNDLNQLTTLEPSQVSNYKYSITINMGILYRHLKDYQKAKDYCEKALRLAIEQKNKEFMRKTYTNLALLYEDMDDQPKCIEYTKKELMQCDPATQSTEALTVLSDLGSRYRKWKKYKDSIAVFRELESKHKLFGGSEEVLEFALDSILELENLLEKGAQVLKFEPLISHAKRESNLKAEFSLILKRAELYQELERWKEAASDYLALLNILTRTNEPIGDLVTLYQGLAYAQYNQQEYEKSINSFRQMFQYGKFDLETKAVHLLKYSKALASSNQNHDMILKVLNEIKDIAGKLADLDIERECLMQQEALHRKWQYPDRAKQCRQRIIELDELIREREEKQDYDDELGSVSSGAVDEIEEIEQQSPIKIPETPIKPPSPKKKRVIKSLDDDELSQVVTKEFKADVICSSDDENLVKSTIIKTSSPVREFKKRLVAVTPKQDRPAKQNSQRFSTPLSLKQPSQNSSPRRPLKIRLCIEYPGKEPELLAIPCHSGPNGTPKTIKWLMDEAAKRFRDIYKVNASFY